MLALIGRKVGMTQLFNEEGLRVPLTVIQVEPNVVVRERTAEKNGYSAMVLGADPLKKSRIRKPYAGQFPQGADPTRFLLEFKDFDKECKEGDKLGVEIFEGVRFVDVRGTTIEVRDRGVGIDPDELALVFDRFYRATAARSQPGSGLGLSIVQQIAEMHGGRAELAARAGGGTIARLTLPEPTAS